MSATARRSRRSTSAPRAYIRAVASAPPPAVIDAVRAALARASPDVDPKVLDEFVVCLDPAYFTQEAPEDVASHVAMAAQLTPVRPARLGITPREHGRYDVAVGAFDYFAEFSILCGLLAAHRLDIQSCHIHPFALALPQSPPAPPPFCPPPPPPPQATPPPEILGV